MFDFILSLDTIATNILVLIGVFIIVNSVVQAVRSSFTDEAKTYSWQARVLSGVRLIVINVALALPLFILKYLHELQGGSMNTYLFLSLGIIVLYLVLAYRYLKSKNS